MHAILQMTGAQVKRPPRLPKIPLSGVPVAPAVNNTDLYAGVFCKLFGVTPSVNNLTEAGAATLQTHYLL